MTDRELLELAAKAVGLEYYDYIYSVGMREQEVHCVPHCGYQGPVWNPLTDDDDALRLSVKLDLDIDHGEGVYAKQIGLCIAIDDGDPFAEVRRAIVRAAAEIGKTL